MLVPHCLAIKTKIEKVLTVDAHLGPSLFRAFPRTMPTGVLRTTWDVIIVDEDLQETVEDASVRSFIASLLHCFSLDC
jgi:hypothetical protein